MPGSAAQTTKRRGGVWRITVVATLVVGLLAFAVWLDPLPEGLAATYVPADQSARPITRVERDLSAAGITAAWNGSPPDAFQAIWRGSIATFTEGTYTFALTSEGASRMFIDDRLIVDRAGGDGRAIGSLRLDRGVHGI